MFTTPASSAPTLSTTTSAASPTSPSRSGRLRGLSYLRNYTHSHLHSHSSNSPPSGSSGRPNITRIRSSLSPSTGDPDNGTSASAVQESEPPYSGYCSSSNSTSSNTGATSGWLPSVTGQSGPFRISGCQQSTDASDNPTNPPSSTMTRNRAETAVPQLTVRSQGGPTATNLDDMDDHAEGSSSHKQPPSIRFIPHQDPRAARPSLVFPTISRTLPDESAVIRVGRYSERDNIPEIPPNVPSAAAVGFKSKVVSRKHCEFWCSNSQWYIKDVKSSSGTFLNHIRLSQPNVESKPFKVKDGDVVQLGIDFRGGEEMIFRCVKIRIECNRGWQQGLNNFNKQTHQRLRNLAKAKKDSDSASTHNSECSICLTSIAPCQSLFVAPCSHVWHYKCIRPILNGPTWPNFLCPNCRAVADLEADVEEPNEYEEWDEELEKTTEKSNASPAAEAEDEAPQITPRTSQLPIGNPLSASGARTPTSHINLSNIEAAVSVISIQDLVNDMTSQSTPLTQQPPQPSPQTSPQRYPLSASTSPPIAQPVPIMNSGVNPSSNSGLFPGRSISSDSSIQYALSPDRVVAPECPMTPRNDAGPFVFDGSAGRGSGRRGAEEAPTETSINGAAPVTTLPPLHITHGLTG